MKKPLVSVVVITYNQEKYISQTLDSILEQKTNYEFEIVIGEDCSQDNTYHICLDYQKKYPDIIRLLANTVNIGLVKNYYRTVMACQGKYIAQCAGDDYWIDPLKLQKQADFLEANQDYGLVYSDVDFLYEKKQRIIKSYYKSIGKKNGDLLTKNFEDVLKSGYSMVPLTFLFKKIIFESYYPIEFILKESILIEDLPLIYTLAVNSKVKYIDQSLCVYRIHNKSISNNNTRYKGYYMKKSSHCIINYFANIYNVSIDVIQKIETDYYNNLFFYGFLLKKTNMAIEAYQWKKNKEIKISFKNWIFYFSSRYSFLRYLLLILYFIYKHLVKKTNL